MSNEDDTYIYGLDVLGRGGHSGGGHHGGGGRPRGGFRPGGRVGPYWGGWYDDYYAPLYLLEEDEDPECDYVGPEGECLQQIVEVLQGLDESESKEILGMYDLNTIQRNMNTLTPVTVDIAHTLLSTGQSVIAQAIAGAKQPWYKSDLPGDTARKNVQAHLQWHADNLTKFPDSKALYPNFQDLKSLTVQAFIEANSVETGAAWIDKAWTDLWDEIQRKLAAIPKAARDALVNAASNIVQNATGIPMWAWIVGGVALTGVVGYGAYKILTGPLGQTATAVAVKRYLP